MVTAMERDSNKPSEDTGKAGSLVHFWEEHKWYSHAREQFTAFKNISLQLPCNPTVSLHRKMKICVHHGLYLSIIIELSIVANKLKQSRGLLTYEQS